MTGPVSPRPRPRRGGEPHPWLQPLWRRVAIFVFCLAWLGLEVWRQETLWILMVVAATAYAAWDFFLRGTYSRRPAEPGD